MKIKETQRYILYIVLQSVLYGYMDIVTKHAYRTMSAPCFLFLRYLLAAVILLILWGRQIFVELRRVPVQKYIVPGLCMASAFIFSNLALQFTAATNMSFIRSLSALIVPILALVFCRQKFRKSEPLLMLCMLVGLYLLCAKGGLNGFGPGEALALLAATLVAGSLVFGKGALEYIGAKTLSFVQTMLAVFLCGIFTVATGNLSDVVYAGSPQIIASLFYAAVGCTIVGYMLQNVALQHIPAKQIGIVQCLYPISTTLFAFIFLGERLSIAGIIGALIITACVIVEDLSH